MATKKLTAKQRAYCDAIALEGLSQSDAYRSAYNAEKMSDAAIWTEASLLSADPRVAQRVAMLRERRERSLVCSSINDADLVRSKLRAFIETAQPQDSAKIKATELLGRASGVFLDRIETSSVDRTPAEISAELADRLAAAIESVDVSPPAELLSSDDEEQVEHQTDDDQALH